MYPQFQQRKKAFLISNKTDFKSTLIKRDRKEHFVLIIGKVHQDDLSILKAMHQMQGYPHL